MSRRQVRVQESSHLYEIQIFARFLSFNELCVLTPGLNDCGQTIGTYYMPANEKKIFFYTAC